MAFSDLFCLISRIPLDSTMQTFYKIVFIRECANGESLETKIKIQMHGWTRNHSFATTNEFYWITISTVSIWGFVSLNHYIVRALLAAIYSAASSGWAFNVLLPLAIAQATCPYDANMNQCKHRFNF